MLDYDSQLIRDSFEGRLAKILSVSDDQRILYLRLENGTTTRITADDPLSFDYQKGKVIIWTDDSIAIVPDELWVETTHIGVIRKVLKEKLVIESNIGLRMISLPNIEVLEGWTISFFETGEFCSVLDEAPIRIRDFGLDGNESIEQYKMRSEDVKPNFSNFGGYKDVIARAQELIETQLGQQEKLKIIGARPVKGVIFSGPPGTGKTLLAQIIAEEAKATFYIISGPSVVSKWVGDSEGILRRIFEDAAKQDRAIIFFDEIDSIAEDRRGDTHEASKRLVAQLLTLLDGFDRSAGNIIVVAATNRIEDIDEALLRPGRFDWEIKFGMPSLADRLDILRVHMKKLTTSDDLPIEEIAIRTEGWSPAKLASLWTEAALITAGDKREKICDEDLVEALERVNLRPIRSRETIYAVN